jgi:phage N-6-adenine-methyltransferase
MNELIYLDSIRREIESITNIEEGMVLHPKISAVEEYARRCGILSIQNNAAKARIHLERKLAPIIRRDFPEGRPKKQSTDSTVLRDVGISKYQSSRWQKEEVIPEDTIERYFALTEETKEEITSAGLLRFFSSSHIADDTYEWFTPPHIIEAVKKVLGEITLDPATSPEAQSFIQAKNYYTSEDDGLIKPWFGSIFLNPPYNMPHVAEFTAKARLEYEKNSIEAGIILTNNATDTDWFLNLAEISMLAFTKGRLKFFNIDDKELATRQGQAFFYLGKNQNKFKEVFTEWCFLPNL